MDPRHPLLFRLFRDSPAVFPPEDMQTGARLLVRGPVMSFGYFGGGFEMFIITCKFIIITLDGWLELLSDIGMKKNVDSVG
jgi:hypothetical protein